MGAESVEVTNEWEETAVAGERRGKLSPMGGEDGEGLGATSPRVASKRRSSGLLSKFMKQPSVRSINYHWGRVGIHNAAAAAGVRRSSKEIDDCGQRLDAGMMTASTNGGGGRLSARLARRTKQPGWGMDAIAASALALADKLVYPWSSGADTGADADVGAGAAAGADAAATRRQPPSVARETWRWSGRVKGKAARSYCKLGTERYGVQQEWVWVDGWGEDGQQRRAMRPEAMDRWDGCVPQKWKVPGWRGGRTGDGRPARQGGELDEQARVACNRPILKAAASSGG